MNELDPEDFDLLTLRQGVSSETPSFQILLSEMPIRSLEPAAPKNRYHQNPVVACAECLFKLGYGYNRIARLLYGNSKRRHKVACWAKWHEWKRESDPFQIWKNTLPKPHKQRNQPKKYKDLERYKIQFKAKKYLRRIVWSFFKHGLYPGVVSKLLGCSRQQFIDYLQRKFKPGMTMENYGSYWVLDHIHPCKYFDLTIPLQRHICFHYSNYQPLRTKANLRKSATRPTS